MTRRGAGKACAVILLLAPVWVTSCGGSRRVAPAPLPALETTSTAPEPEAKYRLQAGDILRVKFLYHPEMDIKLPIRPDGSITLQPIGEVIAAGLTAEELADVIRGRSSRTLREPEVTVIVAQVDARSVYVGGEVRSPGFVRYQPGLTPLQAILARGGFTDTARPDSVIYMMAHPRDYEVTRLNLADVLRGKGENVQLAANDMIYVPRSFIGDVAMYVDLYLRRVLPIPPRIGFAP